METPVAFAPKVPSGVEVIDEAWKGIYHGGSYLFYGWARSGRDLLTLQTLQAASDLGERALFISPRRPKDLVIQSASIGFNLRAAYDRQTVKLMRIPPTLNLQQMNDDGLNKAMSDLVSVIWQYKPDRTVIDDFTPFVQFQSFDRFRVAFVQMLEQLDPIDMTLVLTMGEPANSYSQRVVDFISGQMTGSVHIEQAEHAQSNTLRKLTLMPNIGHIEGKRTVYLDLADVLQEPTLDGSPRTIHTEKPQHKRAALRPGEARALPAATATADADVLDAAATPADDVMVPDEAPVIDESTAHAEATDAVQADGDVYNFTETEEDLSDIAAEILDEQDEDEDAPMAAYDVGYDDDSEIITDIESASAPLYDPVPLGRRAPADDAFATEFHGDSAGSYDADYQDEQDVPFPSFAGGDQAVEVEAPAEVSARQIFRDQLETQFERRAEDGTPFLLMAMRLDGDHSAYGFDFNTIRGIVGESLYEGDALLADDSQERMVVLLPESPTEEAQRVFSHLKARLREEAPEQAEQILRAVSAIVVPDGKPFTNADEFLAYALDEE